MCNITMRKGVALPSEMLVLANEFDGEALACRAMGEAEEARKCEMAAAAIRQSAAVPPGRGANNVFTDEGQEMEKYVEIRPVVMEGLPDAHKVFLKVTNQSFCITSHACETKEEAEWMRDMLCVALAKIVADSAALASQRGTGKITKQQFDDINSRST